MGSTSFVFTLTDKDTGKVRFGISLNYYRSYAAVESPSGEIQRKTTVSSERRKILTSLCLITHHPFFSKFRQCLQVLKQLMEFGEKFITDRSNDSSDRMWNLLTKKQDVNQHALDDAERGLVWDIESWIWQLLSAPAPIPGRSCVHLSVLPESVEQRPLLFALPDKTRLSLIDFPLHLPLELLGVETCLKVLTAIMLEEKVLLQSRDYNALTMSVMAFTTMMYPLQYMFPAIPLLPASLDGAENVMGSSQLEPIPPLPAHERHELVQHLERALKGMSCPTQTAEATENKNPPTDQPTNPGDDVDAADVATRVAMVRFFNSHNILANLTEHTRTIRLYPRPVVAFQQYSFLKSRQTLTPFIRRLAQTQAVEFLSEWSLYPENEVFQRIHAGITDPSLIGDKAKWFATALPRINFDVWTEDGCQWLTTALAYASGGSETKGLLHATAVELGIPNDYASYDVANYYRPPRTLDEQLRNAVVTRMATRNRKKTRPARSVDGGQSETDETPMDARTLAAQATIDRSATLSASSDDNSSDLDDTDIWDLKHTTDPTTEGTRSEQLNDPYHEVGNLQIQDDPTGDASRTRVSFTAEGEPVGSNGHVITSSEGVSAKGMTSGRQKFEDLKAMGRQFLALNRQSSEDVLKASGLGQGASDQGDKNTAIDDDEDELEDATVGKILFGNLGDNWADVTSRTSSAFSGFLNKHKAIMQRPGNLARKMASDMNPEYGLNKDTTLANSDTAVVQWVDAKTVDPVQNSKDQAFLRQVVNQVVEGRALSASMVGRLRDLFADENYRSYLISKLNSGLKLQPQDAEASLTDIPLPSPSVYSVYTVLLQCMIRGLETTCTNHGIGGLASAMMTLEVCHTHFMLQNPESVNPPPSNVQQGLVPDSVNRRSSSSSVSSKQQNEDENPIGTITGWLRGTARELKPKLTGGNLVPGSSGADPKDQSSVSKKLTGQMTGFLSPANRFINQPNEEQRQSGVVALDKEFQEQGSAPVAATTESTASIGSALPLPAESVTNEANVMKNEVTENSQNDSSAITYADPIINPKSRLCGSYRYTGGQMINCESRAGSLSGDDTTSLQTVSSRKELDKKHRSRIYLFEALVRSGGRSRLWDHMQFWEDTFFDAVAQERDILGLDQAPREMLAQFAALSVTERRMLQNQEDRMLTLCLQNLIACMIMMQVDRMGLRTKIRRIQARCRLSSYYATRLSGLLDQLEKLDGNAIDLIPTMSRYRCAHSTIMYRMEGSREEAFCLELYDNYLILRDLTDAIRNRWLWSDVMDVSVDSSSTTHHSQIVLLFRSTDEQSPVTERFQCRQAKQTSVLIKAAIEKNKTSHAV